MNTSDYGYSVIKRFEGFRRKAYKDSVGIWTIGYGSTFYPSGVRVKEGDSITQDEAESMMRYVVDLFASSIKPLITSELTQNQFDALISFAYNVGPGAFKKSTLLKKVNANPNDPAIRNEFMKWNKGKGVVLPGLTLRRKQEADLYFLQ